MGLQLKYLIMDKFNDLSKTQSCKSHKDIERNAKLLCDVLSLGSLAGTFMASLRKPKILVPGITAALVMPSPQFKENVSELGKLHRDLWKEPDS